VVSLRQVIGHAISFPPRLLFLNRILFIYLFSYHLFFCLFSVANVLAIGFCDFFGLIFIDFLASVAVFFCPYSLFITLLVIAGRFYWIFLFLFCSIGWLFIFFALSSHKTVAAMPENTKNICIVTKKHFIYILYERGEKKRERQIFSSFSFFHFFPEVSI